ncbi:MAG TPA: aldehyde dehydrogenase family protein [Nevskiaceae bacterium]|nr:aldehyde dehydrogenase family protein [Nevskiaceae bacterium]
MNASVAYLPSGLAHQTTEAEIQRLFERQRETALRLRTSTADERIAKIRKLKAAMHDYAAEIQQAAWADFKKPSMEVDLTEILPVIMEATDAIKNLRKWMRPKRVWPTQMMVGTSAWTQYEPKGRALIISPWNYPVNLTFGPLVSALAAGCTAILKPSEMTPHLAAVISKITRAIFAEDEVAVVEGDATVSTALLALPFDHIFFTGSPAIGKVVMAAAAKHLTSVTLELGGKSPTIVDETADLELAARNIAWGKFTNSGQTCIAPDHLYVHASVKERFVGLLGKLLADTYGASSEAQQASPYLARVVNQRHTQRVSGLLEDAKARGAQVVSGGGVNEKECFVAPTLLVDVPAEARIQQEEIFGPLLPVMSYQDLDEVIERINSAPKPLALYLWSRNEAHIDKVLKRTSSGGACINHTVVHFLHGRLPFGGVNNSGIGSAHGHYGFMAFSHERAVVRTRFMLARMFFAPYGERVQKIVKLLLRIS